MHVQDKPVNCPPTAAMLEDKRLYKLVLASAKGCYSSIVDGRQPTKTYAHARYLPTCNPLYQNSQSRAYSIIRGHLKTIFGKITSLWHSGGRGRDVHLIYTGSVDSMERGTVEWNGGMVERWNGIVEWWNGRLRLTTLYHIHLCAWAQCHYLWCNCHSCLNFR
jgi:hypothetical protein